MGVAVLRKSGFIKEEHFNDTTLSTDWEVIPNDYSRISLTDVVGSLRLKHGTTTLYAFLSFLTDTDQFIMDIKNNYNPLTEGDVGGVVVYAGEDDALFLEELFDPIKGTIDSYPWIRLERDYNNYYAYWSIDGISWNLIGTHDFDRLAPKIGLFLDGSTGEYMDIDYLRITTGRYVTVENLTGGVIVKLIDSTGTEVDRKVCRTGSSKVSFDLKDKPIPFNGRFEISVDEGTTWFSSTSELHSMWGGDVYSFEITPIIYFYNEDTSLWVQLDSSIEEFLGYLSPDNINYREIKMKAVNQMQGKFSNVTITLSQYNGTDQYLRLVSLANDAGGVAGTYNSSITISEIVAGGEVQFWLKCNRESDPTKFTTELFFGLDVAASYIY